MGVFLQAGGPKQGAESRHNRSGAYILLPAPVPIPRRRGGNKTAKITTGYTFGITEPQARAMRLISTGESMDRVARITFNCTDGNGNIDEKKLAKAKRTIRKWMADPKCQECYRAMIREEALPEFAKALQKMTSMLDSKQEWLVKGVAEYLISLYKPIIFGEEDKSLVIKFEGNMPELGEPTED